MDRSHRDAWIRQCLDSVLIRTDEPYELILVDNGSTDGTPDYLHTIPNAKVMVTNVDIALGRVGVNGTDLVAEALFGSNVTVEPNVTALVAAK